MNFGTRLKTLAQLAIGYDKAALHTIKSISNFTNEPAYFNGPIYGLTPPDIFLGSVDYRGVDNPLTNAHSGRNFLELFDCVPEIFAPIHAIASRIANADFQLRKVRNDQVVYDNEDWNRLFNQPNPMQHFRELIYEAVVYELVTGNEYMYFNTPSTLVKDYKNVAAIWNLPAEQIEPVPNSSLNLFKSTEIKDVISKYKLDKDNFFLSEDVLHIKAINLKWKERKIKGRSPLLSADKAIANLIAVYEARNVIYTKKGALGAIVSRKSDESGLVPLGKGEKERMQQDFQMTYGITGNRSLYAVTDQPVDFIKFGGNIQELQPFDETLADAAAIYGALNVPFELAPKMKGETFANQAAAERSMYENTIIPKANMYMQSLTNQLGLSEAKLYLYASFEHVTALQENKTERAKYEETMGKVYLQRFRSGVCTINDWIVATDGIKDPDPLCDMKIFQMTDEQILRLIGMFRNTQTDQTTPQDQNSNTDGNANNDQQQR